MELTFSKYNGKIQLSKTNLIKGRKRESMTIELERITLPESEEMLPIKSLELLYADRIEAHRLREFGQ